LQESDQGKGRKISIKKGKISKWNNLNTSKDAKGKAANKRQAAGPGAAAFIKKQATLKRKSTVLPYAEAMLEQPKL